MFRGGKYSGRIVGGKSSVYVHIYASKNIQSFSGTDTTLLTAKGYAEKVFTSTVVPTFTIPTN